MNYQDILLTRYDFTKQGTRYEILVNINPRSINSHRVKHRFYCFTLAIAELYVNKFYVAFMKSQNQ